MRYLFTISLFLFISLNSAAQIQVSGSFPELAGMEVTLHGFEGFNTYVIDQTTVNDNGQFSLTFAESDFGMGYLSVKDSRPFFVILAAEGLKLQGENLSLPESVDAVEGVENQLFAVYASEHPRRSQVIRTFEFLEKIYETDPLFKDEKASLDFISKEILRLNKQDKEFLNRISDDLYVHWYLPVRKLVSSVSYVAQYSTDDIPVTITSFRDIDHTDSRLHKSGLLKDVIDSHYWLIENSGKSLDSVFYEMNISIDHLIDQLVTDEDKFNEITAYLFELLERRSLFTSAEHLALKVLNETTCTLEGNLAKQLESYRAMKPGNIAKDLLFIGDVFKGGQTVSEKAARKMSQLKSDYIVVAFGSAWCPACKNEIPQIVSYYPEWKKMGVEVVYVSLDRDRESFYEFVKNFPFVSFSDYRVWEMEAVKSYHIFGTPTFFLIDGKSREIILRPRSVRQINAWVDWFLTVDAGQ